MYGKKKMMGGGKMPKPMMKKGGKMSALVIVGKPAKKAAKGAMMTSKDVKPGTAPVVGVGVKVSKIKSKPKSIMAKGGKMTPATFAPKSAKNVKGPSPKMRKGGKMC